MSFPSHVSELPLGGSVESALRQGVTAGHLVAGDLTSAANVESVLNSAITGRKIHESEKPLIAATRKAAQLVTSLSGSSSLISGGSLNDIYSAIPLTWGPGYSPAL